MNVGSGSAEPSDPRPTFRITVRAEPSTVPAVIRLRRLLKTLLRSFQFRALEVDELPEGRPDAGAVAPPREGP